MKAACGAHLCNESCLSQKTGSWFEGTILSSISRSKNSHFPSTVAGVGTVEVPLGFGLDPSFVQGINSARLNLWHFSLRNTVYPTRQVTRRFWSDRRRVGSGRPALLFSTNRRPYLTQTIFGTIWYPFGIMHLVTGSWIKGILFIFAHNRRLLKEKCSLPDTNNLQHYLISIWDNAPCHDKLNQRDPLHLRPQRETVENKKYT